MKALRSFCLLGVLITNTVISGCEYAISDVATRIRYALRDARAELDASTQETLTITLAPNHLPDRCPDGGNYKLLLTPYKGNKQVAVGDITVRCARGNGYYTGLGSTDIFVTRELSVDKQGNEPLRITLRKAQKGVEIVAIE